MKGQMIIKTNSLLWSLLIEQEVKEKVFGKKG